MESKIRIALVEPSQGLWETGEYCRHSQLEPLGLCYLAAVASEAGHTIDIFLQENKSNEKLIEDIYKFRPDIVGFSTHTYNFLAACKMASSLKKLSSSIITVFGGHHISTYPEAVRDQPIDYGVIGEGELTFTELIKYMGDKTKINNLTGIIRGNGNFYLHPERPRIKDLDKLPWPTRNLNLLSKNKVESIVYPPPKQQRSVTQIISSRGCRYNCIFCCSPKLWGREVVFRSPQAIVDEIEHVNREYGTNLIHFADLAININEAHLLSLCDALIKRKLDIHWTASCNIQSVNERTIKAMAKAKCSRLAFGIESISYDTLERIKPHQKLSFIDLQRTLALVRGHGIFTRGFFMIGYPWVSLTNLKEMENWIPKLNLDDIRITFITPFPGTLLYEQCLRKGHINHLDFTKFTVEEPILPVNGMSKDDLIAYRQELFKRFYKSNDHEKRCNDMIKNFPDRHICYDEFFKILEKKGLLD